MRFRCVYGAVAVVVLALLPLSLAGTAAAAAHAVIAAPGSPIHHAQAAEATARAALRGATPDPTPPTAPHATNDLVPLRYGWAQPQPAGVSSTSVIGGHYGKLKTQYWICRVPTSSGTDDDDSGYAVGKLLTTLGFTVCTYADPADPTRDVSVTHGFQVLVSANLGTWSSAVPGEGYPVPAGDAPGTAPFVGRGVEDAEDIDPGTAMLDASSDSYVVHYGDHGDGKTATGADAQVLVNSGKCPDYDTSPQTCGDGRVIAPSPGCLYGRIIARPLALDAQQLLQAQSELRSRSDGRQPVPELLPLPCVNHQAFVYLGTDANHTSGFYGMHLGTCTHILCGQGLLCNDVWPGKYHFIEHKDLCLEPDSYIGREFECAALAQAEAAVRPKYDTCDVPTASEYQLTIKGHNCHNYVVDVVTAYDGIMAARGTPRVA